MRTEKPVYYTAAELTARGSTDIPRELVSTTHLIYSSPATLAFNSPGAEGYGVKRAGLAVPGSVMLIVSPGCCGRNTSAISRMPGYEDRFFYLTMDETDLVTGRHLKKIPRTVAEVCRGLEQQDKRPRVVMICITCVDALLGTDMERICRRAQEKVPGVRVQPCYMYALTREGRKPPMVHVRQSIYELLEPRKKRASSVNLLGFFAPLEGSLVWNTPDGTGSSYTGSELLPILGQAGVRRIRQIGSCPDYDAFQEMAEANFNIVLNPEARPAAYDLQERLGIPFIEMSRFYQIDRIEAQYAALGRVLQTQFDDSLYKKEAEEAVDAFRAYFPDAVFSVGEAMNGNPFELACALVRQGFEVREIFGTVNKDSYVWLGILDRLSPQTRIYSNLHPSMLHYSREEAAASGVTICIGRDAAWYHPEAANVQWITDVQPFGYRAVTGLFRALKVAMETGGRGSYSSDVSLGAADIVQPACTAGRAELFEGASAPVGFRRFTTPFAPDQSGCFSLTS
jgi:nitrogenase molybdenum-cofactor synthesis protein NifE